MAKCTKLIKQLTKLANSTKSSNKFRKYLNKKYKKVGMGTYRVVYEGKDDSGKSVVFKVDRREYTSSCKNEYENYKTYKKNCPKLINFVLPVIKFLDFGYISVIVFPKVITLAKFEKDRDTSELCDRWQRQYDFISDNFSDTHDENLGIYKKLPVVIDYEFGTCGVFDYASTLSKASKRRIDNILKLKYKEVNAVSRIKK